MRRLALIPLLGSLSMGTGCGGGAEGPASGAGATGSGGTSANGGSKSGGGATGSDWATRCQSVVEHNASCGKGSDDQAAVDECIAVQSCAPSAWSGEVVDSIMSCLAKLPCDQSDDDCIDETTDLQTPAKLDLFDACQRKAASCPGFDGCIETMFLISDPLALKLSACLDLDCDAAAACILDEYTTTVTAAHCSGELPFGG